MIDDYLTPKVYAADATSQAIVAAAFGGTPTIRVPNSYPSLLALPYDLDPRVMIAWMNGTELELSRIGVSVNTSNNEVTLYLRGRTSTATGIFGVDSSWTVTPNPDIPSKTSDLTNDSGYITLADLPIYNGGVS
jgi:hypothetical protein